MDVELTKEFLAEAAHTNGQGLHGHSFRIEIVAAGTVDPVRGWLIDFGLIKAAFKPLYAQLDHHNLDTVEGMTDTSVAGIRTWIAARLVPEVPCIKDVRVSIVGDGTFRPVSLPADDGRQLPARIRFTFEAAQSLPNLPEGHPCRRLHGHTYRVEAGAEDLEALRARLRALYDTLDHTYLNDIPGLEAATSERLCEWIWQCLAAEVSNLTVVVVQETATSRCIYYGT